MNLPELIAANRGGRSFKQMAHESGGLIDANTVRGYATGGPPNQLVWPLVQGLARTLGTSEGMVAMCWVESIVQNIQPEREP